MDAELAASWAFRARGLVGSLLLVSFGLAVVVSAPLLPTGAWVHLVFNALGWMAFAAGAVLRFWATLYIGGRKRLAVVCDGPYSLCRNPLYLGTLLVALSAAITLESLTMGVGVLLAGAFYGLATVPAEERYLRNQLGVPYLRYCQRVPRFWPRLSGYRSPAEITIRVKALRNECRRAARWMWVPVLVQIIAHLRCQEWWPHWLPLP